jgi:hypothetical protein
MRIRDETAPAHAVAHRVRCHRAAARAPRRAAARTAAPPRPDRGARVTDTRLSAATPAE